MDYNSLFVFAAKFLKFAQEDQDETEEYIGHQHIPGGFEIIDTEQETTPSSVEPNQENDLFEKIRFVALHNSDKIEKLPPKIKGMFDYAIMNLGDLSTGAVEELQVWLDYIMEDDLGRIVTEVNSKKSALYNEIVEHLEYEMFELESNDLDEVHTKLSNMLDAGYLLPVHLQITKGPNTNAVLTLAIIDLINNNMDYFLTEDFEDTTSRFLSDKQDHLYELIEEEAGRVLREFNRQRFDFR
jgi:hypothetical protein